MPEPYPLWNYYLPRTRPPEWVGTVVAAFVGARDRLDTASIRSTSDAAFAVLRSALEALGFEVEAGKTRAEKMRRPVLFGEQDHESLACEVDGPAGGTDLRGRLRPLSARTRPKRRRSRRPPER